MKTDKGFMNYLRTVISIIVIFGGLFISIWRILLWDVINRFIYAKIDRLLHLLALPHDRGGYKFYDHHAFILVISL